MTRIREEEDWLLSPHRTAFLCFFPTCENLSPREFYACGARCFCVAVPQARIVNHNQGCHKCLFAMKNIPVKQTTLPPVKFMLAAAVGEVIQLVEYRTRNREVAGSTHTRSSASNLERVANLLCAQANPASYPQRDGK